MVGVLPGRLVLVSPAATLKTEGAGITVALAATGGWLSHSLWHFAYTIRISVVVTTRYKIVSLVACYLGKNSRFRALLALYGL